MRYEMRKLRSREKRRPSPPRRRRASDPSLHLPGQERTVQHETPILVPAVKHPVHSLRDVSPGAVVSRWCQKRPTPTLVRAPIPPIRLIYAESKG